MLRAEMKDKMAVGAALIYGFKNVPRHLNFSAMEVFCPKFSKKKKSRKP